MAQELLLPVRARVPGRRAAWHECGWSTSLPAEIPPLSRREFQDARPGSGINIAPAFMCQPPWAFGSQSRFGQQPIEPLLLILGWLISQHESREGGAIRRIAAHRVDFIRPDALNLEDDL